MINSRETPKAILVLGLLLKCDYSASGETTVEFKNSFLNQSIEQLFDLWKDQGVSKGLNDMQVFCKQNSDKNLIVTAPTGMGKTEASLLWLGDNKGFYILPLKTAINSMYLRICNNIIKGDNVKEKVALLHSDLLSVVLQNQTVSELDLFSYKNLSKRLSLPITVSTPDQIFDFVFKYKGYELKLATLSYSKIIIDEVQAYNAELLSYIIYGIHRIIEMGGNIAIFTATLPPYILKLIEKPYETSPFVKADFSNGQTALRHNVKVVEIEINSEYISDMFLKNSNGLSNKTLVVCNTVKSAQTMYKQLSKQFGEQTVKLLHSKFVKKDRAQKEKEILEDGKSETNKSVIWISTQIVEASLDIDFDYIFTELSELSGLFQRLGRCNRKGLKPTDNYNCFVFSEISQSILISQYNSDKGFIDRDLYELSKKALAGIDGVIDEKTKTELLEQFFTHENLESSVFLKTFREKYSYVKNIFVDTNDAAEIDKRFRRIRSKNIIPKCLYDENKIAIETAVEILNSKGIYDIVQKENAKNTIEELCVGVQFYEVKNQDVALNIKLNKFNNVEVADCFYDDKLGFLKNSGTNENEKQDFGIFV